MPKSARIWKFLNSLVPKMFDMDSEDEDDDPTELQQPDRPESIHSEEQEEQEEQEEHSGGDSILSELALGPSFRDVANNALKDFTKEGENVMEGTENGWEEERLRQLNGLRSELLQLTAEQRGAKRRSQDVEQAPNCKEDLFSAYSGITQVATARRTSSSRAATLMLLLRHHQKNKYHRDKEAVATARRTSSSRAATLMLLLRHHQKNKYHRDKEAVTVRNGIYDDTAAIDDDVAASSPAENRGAVLPTDLTDDASSPASSLIEEPIDDSQRSLCALDEALTEDQTWEEQFLVKLSVWADTENNLSETVPSDELRNDSLWSEEYTEDEAASSQPRSGELTEDLLERRHGPSPFSSAKPGDEDDCTANNNECCITTSFALARRYPTLFKLAPRIHPATAALLLEDPSLITWQRETLAQGENPFAREGNLKYVPFGLPGTWTRYGYAEILPFNASSALGHRKWSPGRAQFPAATCRRRNNLEINKLSIESRAESLLQTVRTQTRTPYSISFRLSFARRSIIMSSNSVVRKNNTAEVICKATLRRLSCRRAVRSTSKLAVCRCQRTVSSSKGACTLCSSSTVCQRHNRGV